MDNTVKIFKDIFNVEYNSLESACDAWGIDIDLVQNRINSGDSIEKSLFCKDAVDNVLYRECVDHNGKEFTSFIAMADSYDIDYNILWFRLSSGWSLESALTLGKCDSVRSKGVKKDTSNKDDSGLSEKAKKFIERQNRIFEIENNSLLSKKDIRKEENTSLDELSLCKKNGIDDETYLFRLEMGWSNEDASSVPVSQLKGKYICPRGYFYNSIDDMCKAYGIDVSVYEFRRKQGLTVEESLE